MSVVEKPLSLRTERLANQRKPILMQSYHQQITMRKTIYHSEIHETRKGRILNALLAFLTNNRYSIIFTFKITLVKRYYREPRLLERARHQLYMFLVLFPFILAIIIFMEGCPNIPIHGDNSMEHETQPADSLHNRQPLP